MKLFAIFEAEITVNFKSNKTTINENDFRKILSLFLSELIDEIE